MAARPKKLDWLQPAVLTGCLVPLVVIGYRAVTGGLGANPIATALNQLGLLGLILLISSLACTPLKIVFGLKWPMRLRKTLGVMGFCTILLHFFVYFVIDQGIDWRIAIEDVTKRPFIALGFSAFVLLLPLALTSTKGALKRLGTKRWQRLHRLVYLAVPLGVVHFFLRVKADISEPLIYGAVLALLLGVRLQNRFRPRASR
jgi:sulfoxide reductase heme-binding subunit YedZ